MKNAQLKIYTRAHTHIYIYLRTTTGIWILCCTRARLDKTFMDEVAEARIFVSSIIIARILYYVWHIIVYYLELYVNFLLITSLVTNFCFTQTPNVMNILFQPYYEYLIYF